MRMYDIITKKRNGSELTKEEIQFAILGYVSEEIPDYQMAAFLMAVYLKGMTDAETFILTDVMAHSGDVIDLSSIEGLKVDKHSTGGVGDKTTLIAAPIVAACGGKVAKMSGRGLGHTGGTIDKLESIPGFRTSLEGEVFFSLVNRIGVSIVGQSGNLAPADKKLYALRDVTATVESIPLIASSIMSKKIAAGSDCILLDVKTGSGAFMKTVEDSILLAEKMTAIGKAAGKKMAALITNMDVPLGCAVGNSLEVMEAVETLQGRGPEDLTEVCIALASNMLSLCGKGSIEKTEVMVKESIANGSALLKLIEMVEAQGGDSSVIKDPNGFQKSAYTYEVTARKGGYVSRIHGEKCGLASMILGAGRETKESKIDYQAGILLHAKIGDKVEKNQPLATLYTEKQERIKEAEAMLLEAYGIERDCPEKPTYIYANISGQME